MSTRLLGQPLRRLEDRRLLTGQATFVDDLEPPGTLHVAFLRSPLAHARLLGLDKSPALQASGVVAVWTAEDLGDAWRPGPLLVPPPPIEGLEFASRTQVPLAKDKVRYAGEPIAAIVAESRYLAEDARDLLYADLEPLEVIAHMEDALRDGAPLVHDDLPSNLGAHAVQSKGDVGAVMANAHLRLKRRFRYDHGTAAALENRGVLAHWDRRADLLTLWDTTQAPIPMRGGIASWFGLSESQVRVIAPFIGGGFGPKIMMFYPEEVVVPALALALERPIKWIEDREEDFVATTHERAQIHDAEVAFDRDGRILAIDDVFLHDNGAYLPYGLTVPLNAQCTLLGCYDVPNYRSEFRSVYTNKPIVTPYRGAGRQHGIFVMERLLDFGARELGLDPVAIRRRNILRPDQFPHRHGLIYQDFSALTYDSGDYAPALEKACEQIGYQRFLEDEQPRLRAEGRCVGIGVVTYVEGTGIGPYEGARVHVEPNGKVTVATGVGTQGQGHFTVFAQVVAEQLGVALEDVRVTTGDTQELHWGTGTFASRGAVVAGNACHAAALAVREKVLRLASEALEASAEDLELVNGKVQVRGAPQRALPLGELAQRANPMRGAVRPGTEPGLEATTYFGPESGTTANGVHAAILEIDPETFTVKVLRYVVVHDCGTVINPLILEGQIEGGVAQGIGNAFYEQLVFDDQAQLLNASFMDYLLPTAAEVPRLELDHHTTPSPLNPLGIKGAGEAGAIPVGALFASAIENALRGDASDANALELLEIPLSPNRLFELMHADKVRGDAP